MKIYFFGNLHSTPQLARKFSRVISILENNGIQVYSNVKEKQIPAYEREKVFQKEESFIEYVDALIAEGTNPSFESTHLIALAIAHKKQVLYLVEKEKYIDNNLLKLQNNRRAKRFFKINFYTDINLDAIILDFLQIIEKRGVMAKEKPEIKFTLRITSKIEQYLKWRTHNTNISKADFLRGEIEKMIEKDEEFKKFLEKG